MTFKKFLLMKNLFLLSVLALSILLSACSSDDDPTPNLPDRIEVYTITVTSFPATDDNGSSWDVFDGADIFPTLSLGSNQLANLRDEYVANATTGSFSWQVNGVFMENPGATYSVSLWDHDSTSADDFMGGIDFVPFEEGNGLPTTVNISCSGCNTAWQLQVDYHF